MTPDHASLDIETLERRICAAVGCVFVALMELIPGLAACRRCGKLMPR